MKKIWNALNNYISKEQCFLLIVYLGLCAYLKNKRRNEQAEEDRTDHGSIKQLREIFREIPGYELKRAANDLEESIDWEVLLYEKSCNQLLKEMQKLLDTYVHSSQDLESLITDLEKQMPESEGLQSTPKSVNRLITMLPVNEGTASAVDLFCGLSGLGLSVYDSFVKKNMELQITGKEQRKLYCDISLLRMFCHGIKRPEVSREDILKTDYQDTYDLVLADLPKGNNESVFVGNKEQLLGDKEKVFTEWVAIQRVLDHVNEQGKAIIIVTKGALVRQREKSIREILTRKDWLEAVITLPANLYASTHLGFELLILNKRKPGAYREKVFFADISEKKDHAKGICEISAQAMEILKKSYENLEVHALFSTVASLKEIEEQDFSWNPFLYIQRKENENKRQETIELGEIAEIMRGAQISKEEEAVLSDQPTHYWLNIRNIGDNEILFDPNSMLRAKTPEWEEKFGIRAEDILVTSKGTALKTCMADQYMPKAFLCGNITRIRVNKEKYDPYVLYEFLTSETGRAVLESIQSGSTIKVLSNTNLKKMPVPAYKNVRETGEQLKQVYQEYQKEERELRNRLKKRREQLLEQLQ